MRSCQRASGGSVFWRYVRLSCHNRRKTEDGSCPRQASRSQELVVSDHSNWSAAGVRQPQALEERAGRDAGKLLLRSVPSPARAWVDGVFVGNTPLLLILAPGKYQVEVSGQRLESAQQTVDLLPRETRDIALQMAVRYPTTVSIR